MSRFAVPLDLSQTPAENADNLIEKLARDLLDEAEEKDDPDEAQTRAAMAGMMGTYHRDPQSSPVTSLPVVDCPGVDAETDVKEFLADFADALDETVGQNEEEMTAEQAELQGAVADELRSRL